MAELASRLWRWVRLRSRRAFVVVGVLSGAEAVAFVERFRRGEILPIPVDAASPEDAEIIVIIGRVSTQSADAVSRLRSRAPQAVIVAIDDVNDAVVYATHAAVDIVDVDIVVHGLPPSSTAIEALLDAILNDDMSVREQSISVESP